MKYLLFQTFVFFLFFASCGSGGGSDDQSGDGFDRTEMLINLADNVVIPAYKDLDNKLTQLKTAEESFNDTPSLAELENLRNSFTAAYKTWQHIEPINMLPESEVGYRSFMNTFPASTVINPPTGDDPSTIDQNIISGVYNLALSSKRDEQGFPAIDYLLYGLGTDANTTLSFYTTNGKAENYKKYLKDVIERMLNLTKGVYSQWTGGYRNTFIENNGSSSSSSTDIFANEYLIHYEHFLRNARIVIPASLNISNGTPFPKKVEAYYKNDMSKELFLESLQASENIFKGKSYTSQAEGASFYTYLKSLGKKELAEDIVAQFSNVRGIANTTDNSFSKQVESNTALMRQIFDALQKNTLNFKVGMLGAMNIMVSYIDSDGD